MEVFKLHNETEFNVTVEMLQKKYEIARENTLKGLLYYYTIIHYSFLIHAVTVTIIVQLLKIKEITIHKKKKKFILKIYWITRFVSSCRKLLKHLHNSCNCVFGSNVFLFLNNTFYTVITGKYKSTSIGINEY